MDYKATFTDGSELYFLAHYGIPKMQWGVRRYQNLDGSLTPEGRARYLGEPNPHPRKSQTVFVSGSSKTQDKSSGYYRKKLPYDVRYELKEHMKAGDKIIIGDAPGIDRQTQDYLAKKGYKNVEVFSPGKEGARYLADQGWKQTNVDAPGAEMGSKEWLAAKDLVMSKLADKGIAVTIDEGAKATRKNVDRLVEANKEVMVYELGRSKGFLGNLLREDKSTTFINGKEVSEGYYDGYWVTDPDNKSGNVPEHEYGTRTKEIAANKINRENSKKSSGRSWVEEAANDPEHWRLVNDTPGERLYERIDPPKSSGRYQTGSNSGNAIGLPDGVNLPSNWKQMSSSEKGQFMNSVTDRIVSGKSSGRYQTGSKESPLKKSLSNISELEVNELSDGTLWISNRAKGRPGIVNRLTPSNGRENYINVTDKKTGQKAALSVQNKKGSVKALRAMGYTMDEIAEKLDISSSTVSKFLS